MRDPTADASRMTDTTVEYFVSDLFAIEPGEDDFTNPYRFGKQLAYWLEQRLSEHGYHHVTVTPEDWGWCVMCTRAPCRLWVACGNAESQESLANPEFTTQPIVWQCTVEAEVPLWRRLLGKTDIDLRKEVLYGALQRILSSGPRIKQIDDA